MKQKQILSYIGLIITIAIIFGLWLGFFEQLAEWKWINEAVHSSVEMLGGVSAIFVAVILFQQRYEKKQPDFLWVAIGLAGMGLLDCIHALLYHGIAFVFLHSAAALVGGFFFAMVWLTKFMSLKETQERTIVMVVLTITLIIGILSSIFPNVLPDMIHEGNFTQTAIMMNFFAGVFFMVAVLWFIIKFNKFGDMTSFSFVCLTVLFGLAEMSFRYSFLWDGSWWAWHALRLIAYFITLSFVVNYWLEMLRETRDSRDTLQKAIAKQTTNLIRSEESLKNIVQHYAAFTQHVAQGNIAAQQKMTNEVSRMIQDDPTPEKKMLANTFEQIVTYQQRIAKSAYQLAQGDLEVDSSPQSENDLLGHALNQMVTHQQHMAEAAILMADGDLTVNVIPYSDKDMLGNAFQLMIIKLREMDKKSSQQVWFSDSKGQLNDIIRQQQDVITLAKDVIRYLCKRLNVQIGATYIREDDMFKLISSYAYTRRKHLANKFDMGEGLIGQSALEKEMIILTKVPNDYISITSGLGETNPTNILVCPFMYEDKVIGVVELGSLTEFEQSQIDFIEQVMETIAIAFYTTQSSIKLQKLLKQSQKQAIQLQTQEEELRVANEELTSQRDALKDSEMALRKKQVELENTNTELEEQTAALESSGAVLKEKQDDLDKQNQALKLAQEELQQKADELALSSKYKSEFLANMSHELRTPLNSLLILARMLSENKEGNLTPEQVESAEVIYQGGNDLLNLINEVLDLSKVEAGKLDFYFDDVALADIITSMEAQFMYVAKQKNLIFAMHLSDTLPTTIYTDRKRVEQIIKNLLSNAFKFTEKGSVSLSIQRPTPDIDIDSSQVVAFSVSDTGIGMTAEQQKIIFEAFQQADGSTSRRFGGTGLGLSISKELAAKLGGNIHVRSTYGEGSTFTLYLHDKASVVSPGASNLGLTDKASFVPPGASNLGLTDDRDELHKGDTILLVIEDDPKFAKILYNMAHQKGFKCLVALNGKMGLQLAQKHQPNGIILDLHLPLMSGWDVLTALKESPEIRHIPIHIMSVEEKILAAYRQGVMGYLVKPISHEDLVNAFQRIEGFINQDKRTLLLVEDNTTLRQSINKLLSGEDIQIVEAGLGKIALEFLRTQSYDCMVLDINLPDMSGFELLDAINSDKSIQQCPIIVYTGRDLSQEENEILMKYTDSVIVKGVKSPERLLDETALFLHRVIADMPEEKQNTIKHMYDKETMLQEKQILIVDDDMRNAFALSRILTEKGVFVEMAEHGKDCLIFLDKNPGVDLVLMDIMMPVMDGYEAMRRIRQQARFKDLPIIALTAKAMKGDKEKCIEAGANDYLPKPLESDRLLSMLRIWLYR